MQTLASKLQAKSPPGSAVRAAVGGARDDSASRARALTLAAMSLGFGIVQLDVTIVNTALSSMGRALGGGVAELQGVVTA